MDAFTNADTATTGGAANHTWWLDVETANSWSSTSKPANAAAVHGFVDYLLAQPGVSVGIYSTGYQWGVITGTPAGFETFPNWVPGAGTVAQAASYCSPSRSFTGGPVVMTQYPLNGFDGDYLC
jgi:GH25 family lysozyme M1 (1,4-beta-N-acetylmuramidase)